MELTQGRFVKQEGNASEEVMSVYIEYRLFPHALFTFQNIACFETWT